MKEKRIEKEIKKAQKKGIYNPKLKLGIVGLILVIGTVIGVSYAYYTSNPSNVLTIEGTVSKKITVTVYSDSYGKVESVDIATKQTDYGTPTQSFKLTPDEGYQYKAVQCYQRWTSNDETEKVKVSYSNGALIITPNTIHDIDCFVRYERLRTLKDIVTEIIRTANGELNSDDFAKGCPTSDKDECSGVYSMNDYKDTSGSLNYDNPGGTSYYFRGKVDNYVKFGRGTTKGGTTQEDLTWRIVRVNGDGTIRLILDSDIGMSVFNDRDQRQYAGYTYNNSIPCTNSNPCTSEYSNGQFSSNNTGTNSDIKKYLEDWYYNNLRDYDSYITYGIYCNDTSYGSGSETSGNLYYGAYERLQKNSNSVTPQLTCPDPKADSNETQFVTGNSPKYHTYGGVYKLKIGVLSADEIVLAGLKPNYNAPYPTASNYLYYPDSFDIYFWSSSPQYFSSGPWLFFGNTDDRVLDYNTSTAWYGVRPVINLNTQGLNITGEGTAEKPFVIKTN